MTATTTRKRAKREYETDEFAKFVRRITRAYGRRVANGDIDALSGLVALREELDAVTDQAVATLRSEPYCYSWARIGEELGISKQAASSRFGKVEARNARKPGGQPAELR